MTAQMSGHIAPGGRPRVVVELTCDACGAEVVHTDSVPPRIISAYLSNAGWMIVDGDEGHQTTLCPRCAPVAGAS
jgi:hypothetical protein